MITKMQQNVNKFGDAVVDITADVNQHNHFILVQCSTFLDKQHVVFADMSTFTMALK